MLTKSGVWRLAEKKPNILFKKNPRALSTRINCFE